MGNLIGGIIGIVLFLLGIVFVAVAFTVPTQYAGFVMFGAIMLFSAGIGLPIYLLDKLEG